MGAITVYASLKGAGAGVESDYYQQGLRWDQLRKERELGEMIGRSVKFSNGELIVELSGVGGKPMLSADVEVAVFHNAARSNSTLLHLQKSAVVGAWSAPFVARRYGQWVIRVKVFDGDNTFAFEERVFLTARKE